MRLVASAAALGLLVSVPAFAQTPAAPAPAAEAAPPAPPVAPPPAVVETPAPAAAAPAVAPATAPPPAAPPAPPWNTVMKEELLIDSYYMLNFKGDPSNIGPTGRAYDTQSNSFTLNYAKVGLEVDSDPVTVRADIGFGELAHLLGGTSGAYSVALQQGYASLKVPTTQLTIDMGRFNTTAGAEVIEANRNWLYSRSFLFALIPVHHTGLRLNFKVNDMVSVQGTVANGIFADMPDNNTAKTVGLSVTVNPLPTTSVIATGYTGKEGNTAVAATDPYHTTLDLVVSHNLSDAFGLNLNIDYVKGRTATATTAGDSSAYALGAALMGRYVLNEHLNVAARGEFVKDKSLFLVADGHELEGTLMLGVPFAGHLEIRAELRGDFASDAAFPKGQASLAAPPPSDKSQFTGTIAFLGFI